jgi:polyhydroxybutyrate depolymerase
MTATGGSTTATGGTTTASGGTTTASGGTTTATGGTTTATGGTTTAAGGTTTSSGGRTGGNGGRSAGTGGGATGGGSTVGGSSATGGISATGGSGTQAGGAGGASSGGSVSGGGSVGGAATAGASTGDNRSPGCGKTISRPNPRTQQTMDIGGATRYYLLDVPSSADNQTPLMLIFGLHGYDMNNVAVIDRYNFNSRSGGKAITVLPYGEGPPPGDTSHWGDQVLKSTWNGNEANYNFLHTLMTDLESRYCIDKNRVFIAGFSMGGYFTNTLACAHSDWFRAFAPISGGVAGTSCSDASVKPPIMIHHGTADTIVTYSNGEATRDYWVKQNGCSQTSTSSYTGCKSYDACAQPVIFCTGSWEHDITGTASGNIWSFFNGFT